MFTFKLYSSNVFAIYAIIVTKTLTLSVTWPFDSSPALYCKWSIVTMRLSCTVMEIWRRKCWTHGRKHGRTLRWFYTGCGRLGDRPPGRQTFGRHRWVHLRRVGDKRLGDECRLFGEIKKNRSYDLWLSVLVFGYYFGGSSISWQAKVN